ncbi:MAG: peptidylprolyl isomerase [Xanthomonadaceae bacterium]|jgi:peptidyl-prolyl cis-trans isomerase SurA|nr:peptidylprolyl isomerase [Xanthomonadaceae bacterium]
MIKRLIPNALAALLLAVSIPAPTAFAQPIDRIAAVVNEDVILQSEMDRAMQNILQQYAGQEHQLPPRAVFERQLLDRLIMVKLQVAQAQNNGIRVSDQELNQAVASIAQQNNTTVDGLAQRLQQDGLSMSDFRDSVRDEIMIQRLRANYAQTRISVSEGEIDAALSQQTQNSTQYHLAHILVALPDGATPEQIAAGQQKVDGIKQLVDSGEMDFAAAAARYSESPNALEGGDLGWRSPDEIPSAFSDLVKNMKAGDVTAPVRGASGFQLLKLIEIRDSNAGGAPQHLTEYDARHILIRVNDMQSEAAGKTKIDAIRARIAGGASFRDVARETSEDTGSRGQGGDLGWFPANAYGADFGNQIASLSDGEVSQPFRTEAGWHIVQRIGSRQSDVSNEARRAEIRETIGRRKLEEEYGRYIQELRSEAYVSYRIGDRAENLDDLYQATPANTPPPENQNTIHDNLNHL